MKPSNIIKEIKQEISYYEVPKPIARAMLQLGKMGFRVSGHGTSFLDGSEDWGLYFVIKGLNLHARFSDNNKHECFVYSNQELVEEKKFKVPSAVVNYAKKLLKKYKKIVKVKKKTTNSR